MKLLIKITLAATLSFGLLGSALTYSTAQASAESQAPATFVKKRYNIKGTWNVSEEDGQKIIRFSDDFKTKGGPDLKIYLSSSTISELDSGNVESTSQKLGILKSNRGAQSYIIPEDINLSEFKSVVIHCEAFSVLWGGFDIAKTP
ncbi:DM13 domain-containing protein [Hellea balneolensis]|uniref:DM13 domain-containing protein n=1 Tax=Hellea balneolensis TaxID=287478 RepID=UPI0004092DE6|nr:DM13 domain-containing protein [Hellea balneolensis]